MANGMLQTSLQQINAVGAWQYYLPMTISISFTRVCLYLCVCVCVYLSVCLCTTGSYQSVSVLWGRISYPLVCAWNNKALMSLLLRQTGRCCAEPISSRETALMSKPVAFGIISRITWVFTSHETDLQLQSYCSCTNQLKYDVNTHTHTHTNSQTPHTVTHSTIVLHGRSFERRVDHSETADRRYCLYRTVSSIPYWTRLYDRLIFVSLPTAVTCIRNLVRQYSGDKTATELSCLDSELLVANRTTRMHPSNVAYAKNANIPPAPYTWAPGPNHPGAGYTKVSQQLFKQT